MDRMTKANLKFRLDLVNDALGNQREAFTQTPDGLRANIGTITLDWAYDGVQVCRMVGPSGGETNLSTRGTMRQAAAYLDGMLTGINTVRGERK